MFRILWVIFRYRERGWWFYGWLLEGYWGEGSIRLITRIIGRGRIFLDVVLVKGIFLFMFSVGLVLGLIVWCLLWLLFREDYGNFIVFVSLDFILFYLVYYIFIEVYFWRRLACLFFIVNLGLFCGVLCGRVYDGGSSGGSYLGMWDVVDLMR